MMPYGPQFGGGYNPNNPLILDPIRRQDFWLEAPASGPGAAPAGDGSVKALAIFPRGMCSTEQPLRTIADTIAIRFVDTFIGGVCGGGDLIPDMQYAYVTSYLSHRPQAVSDLNGGFFLASHVRIHDNGISPPFSLDDCNVSFNYNYRLTLDHGILAIEPHRNSFSNDDEPLCTGFLGRKGFADRLANSLALDFPDIFHRQSLEQQSVPLTGPSGSPLSCDPDPAASDPCFAAAAATGVAIINGGHVLGFADDRARRLVDIANASDPDTGQPHANYRCVRQPDQSGQCRYVLRAKRINVLPNAVELVWFELAE